MGRPSKLHRDVRGVWRTRIAGREYRFGRSLAQAEREFRRILSEHGKKIPDVRPPITVAGLIARWLDATGNPDNVWRIGPLKDGWGEVLLRDLGPNILDQLANHLRAKFKPNTVRDRVFTAQRCLKWGNLEFDLGLIVNRPTRLPRMTKQDRSVDPAKLAAVLAELPERAQRLARWIAASGARPGEAVQLRWDDVDLNSGTCVLNRHKTARSSGRPRTIYLTKPARQILEALPHRSGYVFLSRLGKPYTVYGLRTILERRMDKLTPNRLRHTFARVGAEQMHVQELAKLLGHRSTQTTSFYYEVRNQRAAEIADGLSLPHIDAVPPRPGPEKQAETHREKAERRRKVRARGRRSTTAKGRQGATDSRRRA